MSEKANYVPKNDTHSSPSLKSSKDVKSDQINRPKPGFNSLPVVEQLKIVTRLIDYFEAR